MKAAWVHNLRSDRFDVEGGMAHMVQSREWSEADITILIENPGLSDQVLAHKLPGHTVQDIAMVRDMLHTYHTEGRISEVQLWKTWKTKMRVALPRLEHGSWTCARCDKKG